MPRLPKSREATSEVWRSPQAGRTMTLTSGSTLEKRYRIENKLGQGGFGAVYQAVDSRLNVLCAIKENLQVGAEYNA